MINLVTYLELLVAVVASISASSGFWAFIMKRMDKNDHSKEMLRGIGHDRILELGTRYLKRGWITPDEYENLHDYLYIPYKNLGGNGTAEHVMNRVDKLKIKYDMDSSKEEPE